ncbi:MAG TPA: hypothetical protein VFA09_18460 [Ktedonobacteraceae bacterium]|nr:hypothetical protein [Ktedonobacteraceae bacterium]
MATTFEPAERIFGRLKGLRAQMQAGEEPLLTIPGIWDGGQGQRSIACDIILTNQRLFGYVFTSFPRERLFLDAIPLASMQAISLRQKSFEPLFRELQIRGGRRSVYIRSRRKQIESLYGALRMAIEQFAPAAQVALEQGGFEEMVAPRPVPQRGEAERVPTFGRQEIRVPFERSSLAITLLFVGGLLLEVVGVIIWLATQSAQTGLPLFFAGLVAVITSILVRRQNR